MCIVGYDVIKTKTNKEETWYDTNKNIIYTRQLAYGYKYFVEAQKFNPDTNDYDRYIIVGKTKFNSQCRRLDYDDFGRYKIRPIGLKDYFQSSNKREFNLILIEYNDTYDVYIVD